jgi:hypothetical protein
MSVGLLMERLRIRCAIFPSDIACGVSTRAGIWKLATEIAGAFRHHRFDRTRDLFAEAFSIFRNDGAVKARWPTKLPQKKQGATGITTAAPYVASQWGRGDDRLAGQC